MTAARTSAGRQKACVERLAVVLQRRAVGVVAALAEIRVGCEKPIVCPRVRPGTG